jgi:methionyl aminopeptidase
MDTEKIQAQREGGKILGRILSDLLELAKPGTSLLTIEERAQEYIKAAGGIPSFQTVEGYRWATCLCVNEDVVHGIPVDYTLQQDDILTIDVGILYKGYHTDTAWTKAIGMPESTIEQNQEQMRFLKTGEDTLWKAIAVAKAGNHIGHISEVIQSQIEGAGYSIVKSLVGHTIGKELHETPHIPGYLRGSPLKTSLLTPGMTMAIEIIYAQGKGDIVYANNDGWTITTKDGSLSATFEHSVLITSNEPEVLTR